MVAIPADARPVLTLADLEAFDPDAPAGTRYRRFLCPLSACEDKPRTREHRSLAVEVATGGWRYWRCGAKGKLREHWQTGGSRRDLTRRRLVAKLSIVPPPAPISPKPIARAQLGDVVPLAGTAGAAYVEGRGIPLAVAVAAGVKFSPSYYGRPAVLFPLRDRSGKPIAVNGRYIDGETPKTRTFGSKSLALFCTPGALAASQIIVTEGPADALSFAAVGFPAIALVGTSGPSWLRIVCGLKHAALAFDADGDDAAEKLGAELRSFGAKVERWRPPLKDWNETLTARGVEGFREAMGRCIVHARG